MSERILRALMQLFAIIAKVDNVPTEAEQELIQSTKGRRIIEAFLRSELNSKLVTKYLHLFDEFLVTLHGAKRRKDALQKKTSVNSVKVLRICSQINKELTQRQKIIVLIRIFEFIQSNASISRQELEFAETVSDSFNISNSEYEKIKSFLGIYEGEEVDDPDVLYISSSPIRTHDSKNFILEGLEGKIRVLHIKSVNVLFYRYEGTEELNMNGQILLNDRTYVFNQGATLRTQKSKAVYYNEINALFQEGRRVEKLSFNVQNVSYRFKNGAMGVHPLSFKEESGKLVGIMGGSGTGKSTFLNVLNGNFIPNTGTIKINGLDIHEDKKELEGVIGFVSQDDLLIEELTVFQNLYFNTKLCFNALNEREIQKKVLDILLAIGLYDIKDLIVGNPMDKKISGGQRKRLNIALELIREPSVLFVDEPTSGLSSRDSENIMDLLKELVLKGKLIFVVIHQPSSDIYKMFDRMLILDQGGYLIFDGDPIDSVVYFKTHIHHVNAEERECPVCGNVNPEQIFNIIESRVVDEYGNFTPHRKVSPEEWHDLFKANTKKVSDNESLNVPDARSKPPNKLVQFDVFFLRDVLSKLANRQYILINILVGPILAFLLAFFIKYYAEESNGSLQYVFSKNLNIPQYIFIAVVVALFLGLTLSAEEIHKDKKILKRESFLNLSRSSYLLAKILVMFIISAIQTLLFVLLGNYILEVKGLWLEYWAVLFSTACLANAMGLVISSGFSTAKVIYITVPLFIIPQLLFSGVIVQFDKLHPSLSKPNEVPWIGNVMATRWAYEAIAVVQTKNNKFEKKFFELDKAKSVAGWKKDYWIPEIKNHLSVVINSENSKKEFNDSKIILINELKKEDDKWLNLECRNCVEELKATEYGKFNYELKSKINQFLKTINNQYIKNYNDAIEKTDQLILSMQPQDYKDLKEDYYNENLSLIATRHMDINKIKVYKNHLIQTDKPIYNEPENVRFLDAQFYAPSKYWFGLKLSTFWANIIVLWFLNILTVIALYFDLLKRFLSVLADIYYKIGGKKRATPESSSLA